MMRHSQQARTGWWRRGWIIALRTLRGVVLLEDTPRRIAVGSAAGIFASALPIVGQTFIGMLLARLLGGNVIASMPWSWISNPFTTLPMWYGGYRIGLWVLPGADQALSYADLIRLADRFQHTGWSDGVGAMLGMLTGILGPLWCGCVVLGIALAVPGYALVRAAVAARHEQLARRRADLRLRLAPQPAAQR